MVTSMLLFDLSSIVQWVLYKSTSKSWFSIGGTEDCSSPPQALCSAMLSCLARRLKCTKTIVQPHARSYTKNSQQAIRQQIIAGFMSLWNAEYKTYPNFVLTYLTVQSCGLGRPPCKVKWKQGRVAQHLVSVTNRVKKMPYGFKTAALAD